MRRQMLWTLACWLAVFLAIGAPVNLLVAWGCAIWARSSPTPKVWEAYFAPPEYPPEPKVPQLRWAWDASQGDFVGHYWEERNAAPGFSYDLGSGSGLFDPHRVRHLPPPRDLVVMRAGWPLLCVWGERRYESGHVVLRSAVGLETAPRWLHARQRGWSGVVLPLGVMPFRFLAGSVLHGALWYGALSIGPIALLRSVRRRHRAARGLCPSCGYDLKGAPAPACPECGKSPT